MAVRDFLLALRPKTSERMQIVLGRAAILVSAASARARRTGLQQPEGIYKYLQTISIYLVTPNRSGHIFGILSKRVTFAGAAVSVLTGLMLSGMFLVDCFLEVVRSPERRRRASLGCTTR